MKYLYALILLIGLPASATQLKESCCDPAERFKVVTDEHQIEIYTKLDQIGKTLGELYVLQAKMDLKIKQICEFLEGVEIEDTQAAVKTP